MDPPPAAAKKLTLLLLLIFLPCWASPLAAAVISRPSNSAFILSSHGGHNYRHHHHQQLDSAGAPGAYIISATTVPKIFIFGASMVDAGQNSVAMPLRSHADFIPYGSDFFGKPVGRWSNGRTFMDFITEGLGFGLIPAYFRSISSGFSYGVNFASSGSTASNSTATGDDSGGLFCLLVQVDQFRDFQANFLSASTKLIAKDKLASIRQKFSESIYFVETAQNDYHEAASKSDVFDLNTTVSTTIASMKTAFEALYGLGARTFVIMNVPPLGCYPGTLDMCEGEALDINNCNARWMGIADAHNDGLDDLLCELRTSYPAAQWILFDAYSLFLDGYTKPSKYGVKYPFQACCGAGGPHNVNSKVLCGMDAQYINGTLVEWKKCENPEQYLIWDFIHPTESFAYYLAQGVLNGTHLTPPFDIMGRVGSSLQRSNS